MAFKFQRGEYLKDIVTSFAGVCTARSDHLTSCNQYYLKPPIDKDGKDSDGHWYDEHSLQHDPAHLNEKLDLTLAHGQPPG
jgi:hypothetical protein